MSKTKVLLLIIDLIETNVSKKAKVTTTRWSPNQLARTLVKVFDMGRIILVHKNINIIPKAISNVFASGKR